MNNLKSEKIPNGVIAYPTMAVLLIYVFAYQLKLPLGNNTVMSVFAAGFAVLICCSKKICLTQQVAMMAAVVVVSAFGTFYSDNRSEGKKELIYNIMEFVMFFALIQNGLLLKKIKKGSCLCMIAVLFGIVLQYILKDTFNSVIRPFYKAGVYEHFLLHWKNKAYAGFSGYTANAAYYCATLFGCVIFRILQKKEQKKYKKIAQVVIAVLSIFAVILTSKRGLAVALAGSFAVSYMLWKKVSLKTVVKVVFFAALAGGALYFLVEYNEAVGAFMKRFDSQPGGDLTTGRDDIWSALFQNASNPIIGQGTGSTYTIANAGGHNIYVQLYYDHGILGMIPYILFFADNFINAAKRNDPTSMYAQLIFLIYGFSGNPLYVTSMFIVYLIFSAVSIEKTENFDKRGKKRESRYINVS